MFKHYVTFVAAANLNNLIYNFGELLHHFKSKHLDSGSVNGNNADS